MLAWRSGEGRAITHSRFRPRSSPSPTTAISAEERLYTARTRLLAGSTARNRKLGEVPSTGHTGPVHSRRGERGSPLAGCNLRVCSCQPDHGVVGRRSRGRTGIMYNTCTSWSGVCVYACAHARGAGDTSASFPVSDQAPRLIQALSKPSGWVKASWIISSGRWQSSLSLSHTHTHTGGWGWSIWLGVCSSADPIGDRSPSVRQPREHCSSGQRTWPVGRESGKVYITKVPGPFHTVGMHRFF